MKNVKINRQELIKLGTKKEDVSRYEEITSELTKEDGITTNELGRRLHIIVGGSLTSRIRNMEYKKILKLKPCRCGQGKLIYLVKK